MFRWLVPRPPIPTMATLIRSFAPQMRVAAAAVAAPRKNLREVVVDTSDAPFRGHYISWPSRRRYNARDTHALSLTRAQNNDQRPCRRSTLELPPSPQRF